MLDERAEVFITHIKRCDFSDLKNKDKIICQDNFNATYVFESIVKNCLRFACFNIGYTTPIYNRLCGDLFLLLKEYAYLIDVKLSTEYNLPACIGIDSVKSFTGFYLNFTQGRGKLYIVDANELRKYIYEHHSEWLSLEYIKGFDLDTIMPFLDNSIILDI